MYRVLTFYGPFETPFSDYGYVIKCRNGREWARHNDCWYEIVADMALLVATKPSAFDRAKSFVNYIITGTRR